jgi:hypothetical protein
LSSRLIDNFQNGVLQMAQLLAMFDAHAFDPSQSVGSLPIGKHPVIAESSEVRPTSNNDGGYLQFNLKIIDGPNAGATGAYRLNLYNASQKAVEIAHRQMSALCHVTGVYNVQDSAQLHNIPFMIEVGAQKGEGAIAKGYTEIKRVFDINGNEPGKQSKGAQPQQPQQPQQQAPAQAAWQQPAQQAPAAQAAPAWGQAQQPTQQQPAQAAWQQNASTGAAPWGQK